MGMCVCIQLANSGFSDRQVKQTLANIISIKIGGIDPYHIFRACVPGMAVTSYSVGCFISLYLYIQCEHHSMKESHTLFLNIMKQRVFDTLMCDK